MTTTAADSPQGEDAIGLRPDDRRAGSHFRRATRLVFGTETTLHNLRRQMLVRLLLCGLALACLAAAGFYWLGLLQRDQVVHQMALSQGRHLAHMFAGGRPVDHDHQWRRSLGDFAHVRLEWPDHAEDMWAEDLSSNLSASDLSRLESRLDQTIGHQELDFGGQTFLFVSTSIVEAGLPSLTFKGLYRINRDVSERMQWQLAWSVIAVMVAVIAATGALLPVIHRLEGGIVRHAQEAIEANIGTLKALGGAVAKRDGDTETHNHRVTVYAVRLAESLSLSGEEIRPLIRGALLHDVGKIGTPDHILLKPGKLTAEEVDVMKRHVRHGLDIIGASPGLLPAAEIVGSHHEKFDGGGYPAGLRGEAIPLAARIFAIVDVFDALTSERPYKPPMPVPDAQALLREGRGSHFDPRLLDAFLPISMGLFDEIGGDGGDRAQIVLDEIIHRYFVSCLSL